MANNKYYDGSEKGKESKKTGTTTKQVVKKVEKVLASIGGIILTVAGAKEMKKHNPFI